MKWGTKECGFSSIICYFLDHVIICHDGNKLWPQTGGKNEHVWPQLGPDLYSLLLSLRSPSWPSIFIAPVKKNPLATILTPHFFLPGLSLW